MTKKESELTAEIRRLESIIHNDEGTGWKQKAENYREMASVLKTLMGHHYNKIQILGMVYSECECNNAWRYICESCLKYPLFRQLEVARKEYKRLEAFGH